MLIEYTLEDLEVSDRKNSCQTFEEIERIRRLKTWFCKTQSRVFFFRWDQTMLTQDLGRMQLRKTYGSDHQKTFVSVKCHPSWPWGSSLDVLRSSL